MIEFAPDEYCIYLNWYDAKVYCFSLTIDGKTGWRLPTFEEFAEWNASSEYAGVRELDIALPVHFCWTSTENEDQQDTAWVHCDRGIIYSTEGKEYRRLTKPCRIIA